MMIEPETLKHPDGTYSVVHYKDSNGEPCNHGPLAITFEEYYYDGAGKLIDRAYGLVEHNS